MCQCFFFFWLNIWGSNEQLVRIISKVFFPKTLFDVFLLVWHFSAAVCFLEDGHIPEFCFFPSPASKRAEVHTLSSVGWTLNKCCVVKYKFLPLGPFRCVGWDWALKESKDLKRWKMETPSPKIIFSAGQLLVAKNKHRMWGRLFFCFCLAGCLEYLKTPFVSWLGVNTTLGHRDSVMGTPCVNRKKTPTSTMEKWQAGLVFRFALGFRLYLLPMIGNLQLPPAIM